ncbi:hypothetical protein BJP62_16425 [Jeongeupia sp. USM3]|nr:hypothetical protein BJP62_16425 [Jeongeupia sp. USM3]
MLNGVKWAALRAWGVRATSLLVFLILARLLSSAEIGAVAMVSAILAILMALSELGLADYLLYADDNEKSRSQIFWFQQIVATALAIATFILAPIILNRLGQHDSANVIRVMCWSLPLLSLSVVQDTLFRKQLDFKSIAQRSLISSVSGGALGVIAAYCGLGLWSIVIKYLTEVTLLTFLVWRAAAWRPSWRIGFGGFGVVVRYGRNVAGARMLDVLAANLDELIVGGAMGQKELGIYSVGKRIYQICTEMMTTVTAQVAGPVFARSQGDIAQLRALYVRAMQMSAWLVMPFYTLLFLFCPLVVPWVFGSQWQPSVWVLQFFCIAGLLAPLSQFNWSIFMAAAPPRVSLLYSFTRNLFSILALLLGGFFGMSGILIAQAGRGVIMFAAGRGFLARYISLELKSYFSALLPAMLTVALIILSVSIARVGAHALPAWASWSLQLALGGGVLLVSCVFLFRRIRKQVLAV